MALSTKSASLIYKAVLLLAFLQMGMEILGKDISLGQVLAIATGIGDAKTKYTYYNLSKCETETKCRSFCGDFPELTPLCDRNGNCICDCTNMTLVNSKPVPPPCAAWIPSMEHDKCSEYCTQIYQRPSKICGDPEKFICCTCMCKWY